MLDIITSFTEVFDAIGEWIVGAINDLVPMFYTVDVTSGTGELTFLGVLVVVGLGISVIFLLIGIIQRFMHFGG